MTELQEGERKVRADTQRTRNKLLDVFGTLVEAQGLDVSLPDVAHEAGVATATVYRHFDDIQQLRDDFYRRIVDSLLPLASLATEYQGRELFTQTCDHWISVASTWARAATFIRSANGYLERVQAEDPFVLRLDGVLRPVIAELISAGVIPEQDLDYAILIWVTLFDERVIVDLETSLSWDTMTISRHLSATLLAALGHRE